MTAGKATIARVTEALRASLYRDPLLSGATRQVRFRDLVDLGGPRPNLTALVLGQARRDVEAALGVEIVHRPGEGVLYVRAPKAVA